MPRPQIGNVYDYPQYFDLLFADETQREVEFIEAAARKFATRPVRRLLEPGCGGGRLLQALARRNFHLVGFDESPKALAYLRSRLGPAIRRVELFEGDLQQFKLRSPVDAAYCTFNTFRHLTDEGSARQHLQSVAAALHPGGIYLLGFHLLPLDVDEECTERWTAKRGKTQVTGTLRVLSADRRTRLEQIRLSMLVRRPRSEIRVRTEFALRMYTASQFRRSLKSVPEFELCETFDFWYDLDDPRPFDDELTDAVFVLRKR